MAELHTDRCWWPHSVEAVNHLATLECKEEIKFLDSVFLMVAATTARKISMLRTFTRAGATSRIWRPSSSQI
jgi:hypothetical protein